MASFAFQEIVDGSAVLVVAVINNAIGFFMEIRAVRSMEALGKMEQITAKVLRNEQVREVPADRLVPGDIVVMEGGNIVSAYIRLVEASKVRVGGSVLTDESVPVEEKAKPTAPHIKLGPRRKMPSKAPVRRSPTSG